MFKPDSNKTAKTAEVIKVPNYGDQKIDEAKGNNSCPLTLSRLIGVDSQNHKPDNH